MKVSGLLTLLCMVVFSGCDNITDSTPTDRNTFVRFYDFPYNISPTDMLATASGHIIVADYDAYENTANNSTQWVPTVVMFEVDHLGTLLWSQQFKNLNSHSILSNDDGYLLVCDSVTINPETNMRETVRATLLQTDNVGMLKKAHALFSNTDYPGDIISADAAVMHETDSLIVIGNISTEDNANNGFVAKVDGKTLELQWVSTLSSLVLGQTLDYVNGRSAFVTNDDNIIWPATGLLNTQNVSVGMFPAYYPYQPNTTAVNNAVLGNLTDERNYTITDMCKTFSGFAFIGTISNPQGSNANIVFGKLDEDGNLLEGSITYYDFNFLNKEENGGTVGADISVVDDTGETLACHPDGGFVLAGTTRTVENGMDNWLLRIDQEGNKIWQKTYGGIGDETPKSITIDEAGNIVVLGESNLKELISTYLLKTNPNGVIKN